MDDLIQEFLIVKGRENIALCDLLKRTGLCETGGQAKSMISDGLVKVDSEIEFRKRKKIVSGQRIEFESYIILVK